MSNVVININRWHAVSADGVLVVLVNEPKHGMTSGYWIPMYSWITIIGANRSRVTVTQTEAESLGEICDVPMIHISDFAEWANDND
jgi:hypothetical protein